MNSPAKSMALQARPAHPACEAAPRPSGVAGLPHPAPPLTSDWRALMALPLLKWPEHGEALSSHEPMVLDALWRLGADVASVQAALPRLRPRPQPRDLMPAELMQLESAWAMPHPEVMHGQMEAWPELVRHERGQLRERGPQAALAACLDAVLPGAGGAAFHPVIRMAHAWPHGEMARAQAMAYARARCMPLPLPPARPLANEVAATAEMAAAVGTVGSAHAVETVGSFGMSGTAAPPSPAGTAVLPPPGADLPSRLPHAFWAAWSAARTRMATGQVPPRAHAGLIAERMQGWVQTPEHADFAAGLLLVLSGQSPHEALAQLARWAALAYAATASFTVLHLFTASHALIQLHEQVPDDTLWQRHLPALVSAYAAAWLSTARMDLGWDGMAAGLKGQEQGTGITGSLGNMRSHPREPVTAHHAAAADDARDIKRQVQVAKDSAPATGRAGTPMHQETGGGWACQENPADEASHLLREDACASSRMVAAGCASIRLDASASPDAWRLRLLPALLSQGDDHDIKLAAALIQRWQAAPQDAAVWQRALTRLAGKMGLAT